MPPIATLEHAIAGRLRVKVQERRGDAEYFRRVVGLLSEEPGIDAITANPYTGSIVLQHSTERDAVLAAAELADIFLVATEDPETYLRRAATPAVRPMLSAALVGLGALQASRGQIVGPATENLWQAFTAFRVMHNPAIALGLGALGLAQLLRGNALGSAASLIFYAFVVQQAQEQPLAGQRSNRQRGGDGGDQDPQRTGKRL